MIDPGGPRKRERLTAAIFSIGCLTATLAFVGCGTAPSLAPPGPASTSARVTTAPDATSEAPGTYQQLAALVAPATIFAPTTLPEGAEKAASWLPVIDSTDPALYDGPARPNPYVMGSGVDAEVQVVYALDGGWIVVVENFLGDLGDVSGESVGDIGGHPATLYSVNGGDLVQWSDGGKWYGVFGRGVGRGAVLATALGMRAEAVGSP